jgi:hypothetical protein
MDIAI